MKTLTHTDKPENKLAGQIIGAAIEVHSELGPGLLESVYQECLTRELRMRGINTQREVTAPISYKGENTGQFLRIDLLVENKVIVEVKSVVEMIPLFSLQLHTYLKLTGKKLGLLINFNVPVLKEAIRRIANHL